MPWRIANKMLTRWDLICGFKSALVTDKGKYTAIDV